MKIDTTTWPLRWSHGHGEVQALGAMLGPVYFNIEPDRHVQPFAVFPWADEATPAGETPPTGLLARGRGEWPCVPFGMPSSHPLGWNHPIHGESAHASWRRVDDAHQDNHLRLRFEPDAAGPVQYIEREITGVEGQPEIRCRLTIQTRRDCRLPIGLHPVLKLPKSTGAFQLRPGSFQFARSYPREVEPGADLLQSDQEFTDLSQVPTRQGPTISLLNLPWPTPTESLVQLCGSDGYMSAINTEENYAFVLRWDADILPSCLLWISNGGRSSWPWSGRHFALGIEPICAFFDTGVHHSLQDNPISAQGVATHVMLSTHTPLVIAYSMKLRTAS